MSNKYIEVQRIVKVEDINVFRKAYVLGIKGNRVGLGSFLLSQAKIDEPKINSDYLLAFTSSLTEVFDTYTFLTDNQWIYMDIGAKEKRELDSIYQRIMRNINRNQGNDATIYRHSLTYILLKLKWIYTLSKLRLKPNGLKSEKTLKLIGFMKANEGEDRSAAYYAKLVHISVKYLGELCRRELGVNFRSLSNQLLILRILDLFYFSTASFGKIAGKLHFSDQAHFNKFFKKHLGVTPSEFKNGVVI